MRTFEEIKKDLDHAMSINDADALLRYATEIDALGTPQAEAAASNSRGWALYLRDDYTAAMEQYQRALSLHEELGNHSGVAAVSVGIGNVHQITGDYPAALSHYQRALALHEELGDRSGVAIATGNIGGVHWSTGDYPEALEHYHRALAIHEELGDRSNVAITTGNIGLVHGNTGDYPAALEYFHRALALNEELGDRSGTASVTGNIGLVYSNTGDYPEALSHFHRRLSIDEELGNRSGIAGTTCNIGNVHMRTGDYPSALEHYLRALALCEEIGHRHFAANITRAIGSVHLSTGDYPASLEHYHRALALHEELGERSGVAHATGNIVGTYLELGSDAEAQSLLEAMDAMQIDDPGVKVSREQHRATLFERSGDLGSATITLHRALAEASEHGLRAEVAETRKALRDLALKQNDLAGYVEHNSEFTRITEEINGKESALKMAMQAKQREIDAKDREHAQHMAVLHSTLPKHIADRVVRGETVNDHYDNAAVIFLDIVGFTTISDQLSSTQVVQLLESVFTTLDAVCGKHNVVKIKTIGDSYMAVAFGEQPNSRITEQPISSPAERAASASLDMLHAVSHILPDLPESLREDLPEGIMVRIGLHSGPVTAGVIGTTRMQYDVWGDTVNVASRMEGTSEPGRIHVSSSFAIALSLRHHDSRLQELRQGEVAVIPSINEEQGDNSPFPIPYSLQKRGALEIKGKGQMQTYWLMRA